MRIADIIRKKGANVATLSAESTVQELITLLTDRGIGAVVVSEDGHSVSGIVSERDVVFGISTLGTDILNKPISSIMTSDVHSASLTDDLESVAALMTERRIRHMPVVVDESLGGIVSIGDIVKHRIIELQGERDQLVGYLQQ